MLYLLAQRFQGLKICLELAGILPQAVLTHLGKNLLKVPLEPIPVDLTDLEELEHIFQVLGASPLDLAQGNAVEVEVKDVQLSKPLNKLMTAFGAGWQGDEVARRCFFHIH